jgi:hypothetical protein
VSDGILAGPIEFGRAARAPARGERITVARGLVVEHRASGVVGSVESWGKGQVALRDRRDTTHRFALEEGAFLVDGRVATLVVTPPPSGREAARQTASGSRAVAARPARIARASRIWVEGRHDAELVEKVWGDDLRHEAIVVEPLDGVDHLAGRLARFRPAPGRRVGVLVDHLVAGSKEARIAAAVGDEHVLVRGHRFVDVWAAIDPSLVGASRWPEVDRSRPWKDGVCAALGVTDPPQFWRRLLGQVSSYRDLDPSLVGAVEELIDFVTTADA